MPIGTIETEAGLIEALSAKGRFLFQDDGYNNGHNYVIYETPNGKFDRPKAIAIVDDDVAAKWTAPHYEQQTDHYGPWCSTWHIPEFWPWPIEPPPDDD